MTELEVNVPPAELVDIEQLKIDKENPNKMSTRKLEALKKSIQRYGFVVPIITNKNLLVADGEHRLMAAKALGMKQVSVVKLPVDEVERRLIRQVMNKLRGEHDLFLDAEEYYRIVCGDKRDLLKALVNETDVRIDNLLKLREPAVYSDEDLKALAEKFDSRIESKYPKLILQLVKLGANLQDPENVKSIIAKQNWRNGTRILAVWAYDIMTKILKITWTRPKYTQEEILPFIPNESELDCLIATCKSRLITTYLQTLKETFADPGEALRLRWIDLSENVITINTPVKRHNPRQLRISNKLVAMLNALPKNSELIFPTTYRSLVSTFLRVRRRAANTLQNPRLLAISLTTFRHWGATMTYHYTKNILLVQKLLGHKNINNTLKYTQLVHFKDDEFDVATATTVEEAKQLASAGFEKFDELQNIHIFRKPKRLNAIG